MSLATGSRLDKGDIAGIVCYFVAVVAVGIFSLFKSKRNTVSGFFLADKDTSWYIVGASLFASNIGTEHFIGLSGSGAAVGISVGAFEISGLVALQLLGWVFLPVYIASKAYTLPEYIKKRFGGSRIRVYLATLSLILYIFTKISVALYSGTLFIRQGLEWNQWLAIALLLSMTAVTAITGGLKAAIYTEVLQAVSILLGACTIFILALIRVGGYSGLVARYPSAAASGNYSMPNTTCSQPLDDAFVMLREPDDPNLPWPGFLIGQSAVSIWYWAADQMMVQRALAAKSLSHAQGGCILAGYFKFAFLFVMILPGMIARTLWPDVIACSNPEACYALCENRRGCSDMAYPWLVTELLPSGVRGLMLAVMLSALVSDLISIFNSASALFTIDIWSKVRAKAGTMEILIVGRLFNLVLLLISVIWLPFIQQMQGGQLFFYIKAIASYLSPPIGAVYILAISWRRCNEQGAFYGLLSGLLVGITRMVLDFVYRAPECGQPDLRPLITRNFHYMYFACFLFLMSLLVTIVVSLLTPPPSKARLVRTTFKTRFDETARDDDFQYDRKKSLNVTTLEDVVSHHGHLPPLNESITPERTGSRGSNINEAYADEEVMLDKKRYSEDIPLGKLRNGRSSHGQTLVNGHADGQPPPATCLMYLEKFANWFCGFSKLSRAEKEEHVEHLAKVSSLHQDRRARWLLNVNLFVLLSLVIFVFVFFSTGLHDLIVHADGGRLFSMAFNLTNITSRA